MPSFDYRAWVDTQWKRLPSKWKQRLVIAGVLVGLILLCYQAVIRTPTKPPPPAPKTTRNLFGMKGQNQQYVMQSVSSQLDEMRKENKALHDKLDRMTSKPPPPALDLGKLQADIAREVQQELAKHHANETNQFEPGKSRAHASENKPSGPGAPERTNSGHPARNHQKPGSAASSSGYHSSGIPGAPGGSTAKEIKVISAKESAGGMEVKEKQKEIETFLPAGSIFSGTLITGLDVSCGKSSKKDPFPVLLRVKKEAILPNMYRADVRECFLIAAGWGDMGSERAYLRAERLSCIREDGKAIETKIDMYAVGEDGKAGVRGRLVSKTGALISRALLAGFMEGFSKMFQSVPIATIATGPVGQGSQAPFQSMLSKQAMETAGLQGAGSALDRLSKYYIDMAKDIFPVIEIDAGRAVDFVMISGKSLKLQARRVPDQ